MAQLENEIIMHVQKHLGIYHHKSLFTLLPFLENAFLCDKYEEIKTCPLCQNFYGIALVYGAGIPCNKSKGLKYITMAAKQGYAKAQFNLALIYANGRGVDMDYKKAYELCKASAAQNWPDALNAISRIEKKYRSSIEIENTENMLRNGCSN